MEIDGNLLDGFVAPLETSGQEPGEREHDPPRGRRHREKVNAHERERARYGVGALDDVAACHA